MIYLNIAICDDEKKIAEVLKSKLTAYSIKNDIEYDVSYYENGEAFLEAWEKQPEHPGLLFLDMEMPGKNGIEVAREIRKTDKDIIIIFLTAYSNFVFESFKVDAFRYLMKPLKDSDFEETMDAVCQKTHQPDESFNINFQGESYTIRFNDIIYIEVMNRKIWLYCTDQTYRWVGSLSEIEELLEGRGFYRIHRSYLINMAKIKSYNNHSVKLENDYELQISRYKTNDFKEAYINYWSRVL